MAENDDDDSFQNPAFRLRWDVFLSFRGEDTRENFTQLLYNELEQNGVRAFIDNDGLTQGDSLDPILFEAIEDSAASIAIISKNYASSRWCLEELARICECRRLVLPVFYRVDPSDVRRQKGPFEEDFRRLETSFEEKQVLRWRKAMRKVGGISGWVYHNSEEPMLIRSLVKRVSTELNNTPVCVALYAVGLNSRVEELMGLLNVKSNGILVLGFHGMGGIGKTTLAKALYNKLVSQFECRSFISNVRETYTNQNGVVSLQNKLIVDLSRGKVPPVNDDKSGKIATKRILQEKQVLVVLDDVDDVSQLNALIGRREWFHEGSLVIISTRNKEVLQTGFVSEIYEVKELGLSDSLKLFSYHALRRERPSKTFLDLSRQIVSLTGGLPLALEVFGSFLFDKRKAEEWEDALQKLKLIRPHNIQDVLKISFDALDEQAKCIFLDIACLLLNLKMKRDDVIEVMNGCQFRAKIAINVLEARSLIKFIDDNTLWMHDQIRDMGRQIVLHENLEDAGKRSRLWDRGEILSILQHETGTRHVQGIILDFEKKNVRRDKTARAFASDRLRVKPSLSSAITYMKVIYEEHFHHDANKDGEVILCTKSFASMVKLRLLQFSNVKLKGNFKCLPAEIKWLQWKGCTLKNLPSDLCPRELTVLDLSESKIERVWGWRWWCWYINKVAEKLMVLNLHSCCNLTAIPDLSRHHALEKLILERCSKLSRIHKSVGDLSTLHYLNLRDCYSLDEFPSDVSGLKSLEIFILSGCSKLRALPEDIGSMKSLKELFIDTTAIEKLPESIFKLTKLERLSMNDCKLLKRLPTRIGKLVSLKELSSNGSSLEEIPNSIGSLKNLENLSLMWCRSLTVIPDSIGELESLTKIWLNGSSLKELPSSIGSLSYLQGLSVGGCHYLSTLPISIEGLSSVVELQLDRTAITGLPDQIGNLKSLKKLEVRSCISLSSLPESIGSLLALNTLIIVNAAIKELPESIGLLENLIILRLNKCKQLCRLPGSIGKLESLHHLRMEETAVTELPESFGMLSSLMVLKMAKKPYDQVPQHVEKIELKDPTVEEKLKPIVLPSSFSNLSSLKDFDARAWKISGKIPDEFEKLSSLEILNLSHNDFCSLPSSMTGLFILRKLYLHYCKELKILPPLPSTLVELNAANCTALERISDLSNLENLEELHLTNCEKLVDIPGLKCLKSLRRLYMSGCHSGSSALKEKLDKITLKNLYDLSMPGNEIPDWFTHEIVRFSKRKNYVIEGVIIGVVISINHQVPDDLRDQLPVVPDIQAKILRLDVPVYITDMNFKGVPKTHEDQVYLCRYPSSHPLVSFLKNGDRIQVAMRDPPFVKGVELKKYGIHLVFENDDDYDGDEESLDESQQSVSEKLTKFIRYSEENNREVEGQMQEREQRESSSQRNYFVYTFIVFASFFLLLSWLVFIFVA